MEAQPKIKQNKTKIIAICRRKLQFFKFPPILFFSYLKNVGGNFNFFNFLLFSRLSRLPLRPTGLFFAPRKFNSVHRKAFPCTARHFPTPRKLNFVHHKAFPTRRKFSSAKSYAKKAAHIEKRLQSRVSNPKILLSYLLVKHS